MTDTDAIQDRFAALPGSVRIALMDRALGEIVRCVPRCAPDCRTCLRATMARVGELLELPLPEVAERRAQPLRVERPAPLTPEQVAERLRRARGVDDTERRELTLAEGALVRLFDGGGQ